MARYGWVWWIVGVLLIIVLLNYLNWVTVTIGS